jgi:F0F1-type ATP synthase membrane subunit b/b'
MPAQFLPIIVGTINLMVLSVLGFYIWSLRKERKKLEEKERQLAAKQAEVESGYQQIIDRALEKEREILDDASKQASSILSITQNLSSASKESLDAAMQKMVDDIHKEATNSSEYFLANYKNSLNKISESSAADYQQSVAKFEENMQAKMEEFRNSLLPGVQKELEEYKQKRIQEVDRKVEKIIKEVAEKVFNKSIPFEEHQKLIIESLEKARKEGVFD